MARTLSFAIACTSFACLFAGAGAEELAADQAEDGREQALELVTFNIRYLNRKEEGDNHWRTRKQLVVAAMREFDADIFGLQEALREQLDDIAAAVPGYTEFGVGRDDGKRRGEYSPILFRSTRFELDREDSGTFWLSDTPGEIASKSWGNTIPRICTWARLTDRKSRRSFYVYNTHWDHQSQPARLGAARLIAERIAQRRHPDEPVILMGDFNASRENPAIRHFGERQPPLLDAHAVMHPDAPDTATFHGFSGKREGRKIDHIFVLGRNSVQASEILYFEKDGAYPSDHYPVRARLQFR